MRKITILESNQSIIAEVGTDINPHEQLYRIIFGNEEASIQVFNQSMTQWEVVEKTHPDDAKAQFYGSYLNLI